MVALPNRVASSVAPATAETDGNCRNIGDDVAPYDTAGPNRRGKGGVDTDALPVVAVTVPSIATLPKKADDSCTVQEMPAYVCNALVHWYVAWKFALLTSTDTVVLFTERAP
jgi:hypothetical protein